MDKYTGKKLDGRYEIRELIGVGGMANVYRCYDTIDAREVAIKIMKDEFLGNEDFIRRFKNESKAIAVLNHPNIVRVYDVSFGDMIQYIVMEYIDGITLKEYIDMQGVLEWKETVHLTTQILRALQHAHENGIVHRDIKPHNIMLLQDGTIKVTDFGIARFSSNATRTMTEQAIGSVHYIAPEQARGDKTDGKTDIYSVGVMMYEMLTGTLPFDADSAVSVALMQLQTTPRRPREINPSIPEGLEEITIKAMQKNPSDRYRSALEMLSDIERFRLNPSIRFDYHYHDEHTRAYDTGKRHRTRKAEAEEESMPVYDDDAPVRSPALSAIKGVIIAAIITLVVFGGVALVKGYISAMPQEVDVPNFVGQTVQQANANNPGHFVFTYESRYSDEFPVDSIIYQTPEAGSKKIREGSTIDLVVNSSDSDVTVPYLSTAIGTEEIEARVKAANLVPKILYVESQETAMKVDSVYPSVGTQLKIGSPVYIFVSKGVTKEKLEMPDIKGFTTAEAQAKLEELGFTNIKLVADDRVKGDKDEVIRQNPLQGSVIEFDREIELDYALGEESKEATIHVDLPQNVEREVRMSVLIDGALDEENSKVVIPAYNPTYTLKLKLKESCTVTILLDDEKYREYKVDFEAGVITTTNAYNYVDTSVPSEIPSAPDASVFDEETTADGAEEFPDV